MPFSTPDGLTQAQKSPARIARGSDEGRVSSDGKDIRRAFAGGAKWAPDERIGILILAASRRGAGLRPAYRPAGVARRGREQAERFHQGKIPAQCVALAPSLPSSCSSVIPAAL